MIVTLQHYQGRYDNSWGTVELLLCEVKTREEAFAEMRRFLQVNNINLDSTGSRIVQEKVYIGRLIPTHEEVTMWQDGAVDEEAQIVGLIFGFWKDTDRPRYEVLGTPEDHWLVEKNVNGKIELKTKIFGASGEWYNCAKRYFADLEKRNGGGK